MKRLLLAVGIAAMIAAGSAAWTLAAPGSDRAHRSSATQAKLPPLPATVKSRGRWIIGVKCDFPPFGYVTASGKHAGYDVEVAKAFARLAFGHGNRVTYTCVTTPSRIPTLMSKRVDIIISTLTYTKARAEVIDYSAPYYGATGRLLVPNSTSIKKLSDMSGKTIATTRGSIYDRWLHNCYKNTNVLLTDTTSALGARFLAIPWGIGIRKGETDMRAWVNSRIKLMKKRDQFWQIMQHTIPRRFYSIFKKNVPRPTNTLRYPTGPDPETICR